ncbi:MAG: dihydrodipicolinate reductase C-terminal domain-containing protein [Elusimicrobiota bacterium]|nr:dihydrodipicolinate reductase C-terminal domain-containing protein [Elusimicrobiota bacterium]
MASPLKIAVCGASGRTGSRVAALACVDSRFHLLARVGRAQAASFEDEAGACGAVIDFTTPDSCVRFAAACGRNKVPFVTGTTGLTVVQRAQVAAAARKTAVFMAPNFSRGVTMLLHLAEAAARRLPDYDAAIVETHHKGKKDAPSGTALRLAQAVAEGRRDDAAVPTSSLRVGGVVGDHSLTLAGSFERLTLSHTADSRDAFALGALEAALWTARKKPGLYDMLDLMGLR